MGRPAPFEEIPMNTRYLMLTAALVAACDNYDPTEPPPPAPQPEACDVDDGQCIFRNDTFGDERHWTDVLHLEEVVQDLPPSMALQVGLKVDADKVPAAVLAS